MISFTITYADDTKSINAMGEFISKEKGMIIIGFNAEHLKFHDEVKYDEFWESEEHTVTWGENNLTTNKFTHTNTISGCAVVEL